MLRFSVSAIDSCFGGQAIPASCPLHQPFNAGAIDCFAAVLEAVTVLKDRAFASAL